ncbi:MAG: TonB-dependent receptor, partial [Chitinophagaceae bacterium]
MSIRSIIVFLALCFFAVQSFSQDSVTAARTGNHSIRGIIADADSAGKLINSSIVVLRAQDSMLVKFTYAGADGIFALTDLPAGRYVVLVSYPKYADYVDVFTLDSANRDHDFGVLKLTPKSKLLQEVIVQGRISVVKLKGDTTEYNVKNYKVQPNAKVEDLLKQLPGIQVDREGRITAQGQAVNKVLVDGEEFFGDDPTLVTKNIRADMVDKVQVYDKKSDQAILTGIDDGQKEKTINLKIKEDKKNGYFGKLEGGVGTDGFYAGQALYNSFKGKRKFSVYGITGNDGKTGLGWLDNARYASSNVEMTEPGIIVDLGGGDELETFDGRYNGQGIPLVRNGGMHYDNKWDNDGKAINLNYKIGSLGVDGVSNILSQNNLPGATINKNTEQLFNNYLLRNKADGTYQFRIDSTSDLKLMIEGTLRKSETDNGFSSFSTDGENRLLNRESRRIDNEGDQKLFNARVYYQKKFRKPGRTLSVNVIGSGNDNEINGFLDSRIDFYNPTGAIDSTQRFDQYKVNNTKGNELHGNAAWSESLSNNFAVIFNYGLGVNSINSDRNTFNKSGTKYDQLDSLFSNRYEIDQFYNQAGAFFNYMKGKSLLNFGTKLNLVKFKQLNKYT